MHNVGEPGSAQRQLNTVQSAAHGLAGVAQDGVAARSNDTLSSLSIEAQLSETCSQLGSFLRLRTDRTLDTNRQLVFCDLARSFPAIRPPAPQPASRRLVASQGCGDLLVPVLAKCLSMRSFFSIPQSQHHDLPCLKCSHCICSFHCHDDWQEAALLFFSSFCNFFLRSRQKSKYARALSSALSAGTKLSSSPLGQSDRQTKGMFDSIESIVIAIIKASPLRSPIYGHTIQVVRWAI